MLQTPFERDPKFGTRALLNDEEYAQKVARANALLRNNESPRGTTKASYNSSLSSLNRRREAACEHS